MALTPPTIATYETGSSMGYTSFYSTLYTHFTTVSTHFDWVDGTDYNGILVEPADVGETWDLRLWGSGTALASIDPQGNRSDATLSTGSAEYSGTMNYLWSSFEANNGKLTIVEFPDAMFLLVSTPDDSGYALAAHVGRIFNPIYDTDDARGKSGLGLMGDKARIYSSTSPKAWFSVYPNNNTTYSSTITAQYGPTTAEWWGKLKTNPQGQRIIATPTKAGLTVGGTVAPFPIFVGKWRQYDPQYVCKYVWTWWETNTPKTRVTDGSNIRYMHIGYENILESLIIPWNDTAVP